MAKHTLRVLLLLMLYGKSLAQVINTTCYIDVSESTLKLNICVDAFARTHRLITDLVDFQDRLNQLAIDTLEQRGFQKVIFYKVRLFNRQDLESALFVSTLNKAQTIDYYAHPERSKGSLIDSTLFNAFGITRMTNNAKLFALLNPHEYSIRHETLYYMVNLRCGRIWCIKLDQRLLPPSPLMVRDFLKGEILDEQANEMKPGPEAGQIPQIRLSAELRDYLFVEDIGLDFLVSDK